MTTGPSVAGHFRREDFGGDGDRFGDELDLHGNRRAKNVQDRAMRVNNLFELRQLLVARRAFQRHGSPHSGETGTHPFTDGKKSPQVENALMLDRDAIERNAKRRCVERGT